MLFLKSSIDCIIDLKKRLFFIKLLKLSIPVFKYMKPYQYAMRKQILEDKTCMLARNIGEKYIENK